MIIVFEITICSFKQFKKKKNPQGHRKGRCFISEKTFRIIFLHDLMISCKFISDNFFFAKDSEKLLKTFSLNT